MRHRTLPYSFVAALTVVALSAQGGTAQTFIDNYNRTTLNSGGPSNITYSGANPTVVQYTGSAPTTSGSGTNLVTGSFGGGANARMVEIISNAPANSSGGVFYSGTYNGGVGFNSQLNQNSTVSWSLNMKSSTANLGGFGTGQGQSSQFGIATVLAATSNDLTTANGYAIVRGRNGNSDRYDLIQFTGGLDNENNFASIVSGSPNQVGPTNFTSVHVTYNNSTDSWSLFVRDDGATAANPANNTGYVTIGSGTNSTYTSTSLPNFGYYWNYGTENNAQSAQSAYFDNFQAVYTPVPEPASVLGLAACGMGVVAGIRRRFR